MPIPSTRFAVAVAAVAFAVAGCVTPAVPVPPPEPESMAFAVDAGEGQAQFTFDAEPSYAFAVVYVFNRTLGVGVIDTARMDGSVGPTEPFAAAEGNQVVVTFELPDQSVSTCVELRDGRSSSALECGL